MRRETMTRVEMRRVELRSKGEQYKVKIKTDIKSYKLV